MRISIANVYTKKIKTIFQVPVTSAYEAPPASSTPSSTPSSAVVSSTSVTPATATSVASQPQQQQVTQTTPTQQQQQAGGPGSKTNRVTPIGKPMGIDPLILLQERENR